MIVSNLFIWITFILINAFIITKKDHKLQTLRKMAKILKICQNIKTATRKDNEILQKS